MWFNKQQRPEPIRLSPPQASRVEIELHKNASVKAAEKAKEVNNHLNDLLVENGITLKLYIAAGGRPPKKRGTE